MSKPLRGPNIYLRRIRLEDVTPVYVNWLNDPEVNRYLETRFQKQTLESVREYVAARIDSKTELMFAMCLNGSDRHIGNIKLGPINPHHLYADVSLFIGDSASWGKGYAAEAIRLLTEYAFQEAGVQKLRAGCYAANVGSAKAFLKVGYVQEGHQKSYVISDGKRMDVLTFGITPEEFRSTNA